MATFLEHSRTGERANRRTNLALLTAAVLDGADILEGIRQMVKFRRFNPNNDPSGEHDYGAFDHNGRWFFWKVDYYDTDYKSGSPDPSDPNATARVLTLMPASEYWTVEVEDAMTNERKNLPDPMVADAAIRGIAAALQSQSETFAAVRDTYIDSRHAGAVAATNWEDPHDLEPP